ncbi:beta-lactamase family protein, partial [Pseudomonadales bacterium]|nr:beta-lactamase family protein [Pseudomonadales bacterium]
MRIQNLGTRAFWSTTRVAAGLGTILFALGASSNATEIKVVEAETVGMSSERLERIGVGMRRLIDADKIPGTVTLVARRGKVVHFETNGMRDVAKSLPMEKDTIFRLYSQTKPVTGAA